MGQAELQYVDIQVEVIDHKGVMGGFVMSRGDDESFVIAFVFDGERRELSYHPSVTDDISAFKTAFFRDVEEAWTDYIRDCVVRREQAAARKQLRAVDTDWRLN